MLVISINTKTCVIDITRMGKIKNTFEGHKGRPGKIGGSLPREKNQQTNKNNIKIDFTRDNELPPLRKKDLKELGLSERVPVRLKKSIIERNKERHPDISEGEAQKIILNSLYNRELIVQGNGGEKYFHFISFEKEGKSDLTLIDLKKSDDGYIDIIHYFRIRTQSKNAIIKKAKR